RRRGPMRWLPRSSARPTSSAFSGGSTRSSRVSWPATTPDVLSKAESERVVVVSPHLDDAVLSLGAAIACTARGRSVEVLHVFGGDPESDAPAGGWDRRGGFRTEGEATRARREEDRRACAVLGASPAWLSFGDADYERHGTGEEIRAAVTSF